MKKNGNIKAGLEALLTPADTKKETAEAGAQTSTPAKNGRSERKIVCYSIDTELADKIRYIAWYDRKKINEVVEEAFMKYVNDWNATTIKAKNIK